MPRVAMQSVNLSGIGTAPPLPATWLQFEVSTFASQQQEHAAVSLASPSQISASGTLTLAFTPSVTGVGGDPVVRFLATGGRNRNVPGERELADCLLLTASRSSLFRPGPRPAN